MREKGIVLARIHSLTALFPEFSGMLPSDLQYTMQTVLFIRVSGVRQLYLMILNMLQFNVLLDFARSFLRYPNPNPNPYPNPYPQQALQKAAQLQPKQSTNQARVTG